MSLKKNEIVKSCFNNPLLKNQPLLGIVTVLYKSNEVLFDFFSSVSLNDNYDTRLYVIDNSPDYSGSMLSIDLAKKYNIDVVIVFNNENVGVAKGNNQGIELAKADGCSLVLLANNDTKFPSGTIKELVEGMIETKNLVATSKVMFYDEPKKIWSAGGEFRSYFVRTPHYGYGKEDNGSFDSKSYVDYAPTCFMLFDVSVFDKVGMMDEAYFVYWDDADFLWRLKEKNIKVRFVPHSIVFHKVSLSTGGRESIFSAYYCTRNRIYFIRKNFRGIHLWVALFLSICSVISSLLLLRQSHPGTVLSGIYQGFFINTKSSEILRK